MSCSRGELLRSIHLPARALSKRFAFRRASLTHLGRSAIIVIGTQRPGADDLVLTVTAATSKPIQLRFDRVPDAGRCVKRYSPTIPEADYFNDVHGSALYKRHLTYYFAEQIRAELLNGAATMKFSLNGTEHLGGAGPGPVSAHLLARAGMSSASRKAAMRETAAPAPSGSTARRFIAA